MELSAERWMRHSSWQLACDGRWRVWRICRDAIVTCHKALSPSLLKLSQWPLPGVLALFALCRDDNRRDTPRNGRTPHSSTSYAIFSDVEQINGVTSKRTKRQTVWRNSSTASKQLHQRTHLNDGRLLPRHSVIQQPINFRHNGQLSIECRNTKLRGGGSKLQQTLIHNHLRTTHEKHYCWPLICQLRLSY